MSLARYLSKLAGLVGSDGKVPQSALAPNIAGNGPAFSATASAAQSVSPNTSTKIAFNTKQFDTNNNFDTTNNRFTPTVAGYYLAIVSVQAQTTNAAVAAIPVVYKNGVGVGYGSSPSAISTNYPWAQATSLGYCNGTTEGYVIQTSGTINCAGGFFQAFMVKAA